MKIKVYISKDGESTVITLRGAIERARRALAAKRKLVYRVHRVLGIALALWLALLALTGALLMFRAELDWLTTPALRVTPVNSGGALGASASRRAQAPVWDPERVLRGVAHHAPSARVLRVDRPETARSASLVRIADGSRTTELFVHPVTGEVQGARELSGSYHSVADLVRQLHVRVLLGAWGRALVGVLGVLWVLALLTGWWVHGRKRRPGPGPFRRSARSSRPGRGSRRAGAWRSQLHAGLARATLPYALLMGVSGAWLGLETLPHLMSQMTPMHPPPLQHSDAAQNGALNDSPHTPLSSAGLRVHEVRHAEQQAQRVLPGARVATLFPPEHAAQPWLAALVHASPWLPPGAVQLDLEGPHSSAPRLYAATRSARVTGALEALHVGSFAAHAGALAWPLRLLWALLGATPALVALAGLYGTFRRQRVRAAKRQALPRPHPRDPVPPHAQRPHPALPTLPLRDLS